MNNTNNINSIQKGKNILEIIYLEDRKIRLRVSQSYKTESLSSYIENKIDKAYEMVTKDFIKKNLSDYDIIHYAGHVEYDPAQSQKGGWILSDGILSAEDILKMINANAKMPCLIFVNACQSGNWPQKQSAPDVPYPCEGLVYAFMKSGVKYYIGTFSEVPDEYGGYMGLEFYHQLLQGNSIGESLKKARESFREKFRTESLAWINYMLYGNPGDCIIKQKKTGHIKIIKQPIAHPDEGPFIESEKLPTRRIYHASSQKNCQTL